MSYETEFEAMIRENAIQRAKFLVKVPSLRDSDLFSYAHPALPCRTFALRRCAAHDKAAAKSKSKATKTRGEYVWAAGSARTRVFPPSVGWDLSRSDLRCDRFR